MDNNLINEELGELADYLKEEEILNINSISSIVFIDQLPIIPKEKVESLKKFLLIKLFTGLNVAPEAIIIPFDQNNTSKGIALVDLQNSSIATKFVAKLNGFRMDATHVLFLCLFEELENCYINADEFSLPKLEEWAPYKHMNKLQEYIML